MCNTRKEDRINTSPREQRWDASYQGLQWKTSVFWRPRRMSGCYWSIPITPETLLVRSGKDKPAVWEELDFGVEQEPNPIPSEAVWVDSTWKGKAVGKRDNSSNRSLNWDFLVYKWKPGTAANGSQASRLRKAVALTQPLWSETNKLYNDTGGIVNVVLLLGNV